MCKTRYLPLNFMLDIPADWKRFLNGVRKGNCSHFTNSINTNNAVPLTNSHCTWARSYLRSNLLCTGTLREYLVPLQPPLYCSESSYPFFIYIQSCYCVNNVKITMNLNPNYKRSAKHCRYWNVMGFMLRCQTDPFRWFIFHRCCIL